MNRRTVTGPAAILVAVAGMAPALAQTAYKVVGPDGRVTYTDRPPIAARDARIGAMPKAGGQAADAVLPLELRQAVERYPVVLYVTGDDCVPCAQARDLLRRRGVPFAERSIQTPEDAAAFERRIGGREAPAVTIGAQVLRGLTPSTWDEYLDAAGYPRESRLPAAYRDPPATPLAPPAPTAAAASAPAPDLPITLPSLPVSSGPIRF